MKIYNVDIIMDKPPIKPDMRHDWLIRQAEDMAVITDKEIGYYYTA